MLIFFCRKDERSLAPHIFSGKNCFALAYDTVEKLIFHSLTIMLVLNNQALFCDSGQTSIPSVSKNYSLVCFVFSSPEGKFIATLILGSVSASRLYVLVKDF